MLEKQDRKSISLSMCAGHAAPLMNMATFGKHDAALTRSSSDVGEHVLVEAQRSKLDTTNSDPQQPAKNLTEQSLAADGEPAVSR